MHHRVQCVSHIRIFVNGVSALSLLFPHNHLFFSEQAMENPSSSVSTASSCCEYFAHHMWKLLVELLSLEQTRGVIVLFVEEVELAQIAPSYHFAP